MNTDLRQLHAERLQAQRAAEAAANTTPAVATKDSSTVARTRPATRGAQPELQARLAELESRNRILQNQNDIFKPRCAELSNQAESFLVNVNESAQRIREELANLFAMRGMEGVNQTDLERNIFTLNLKLESFREITQLLNEGPNHRLGDLEERLRVAQNELDRVSSELNDAGAALHVERGRRANEFAAAGELQISFNEQRTALELATNDLRFANARIGELTTADATNTLRIEALEFKVKVLKIILSVIIATAIIALLAYGGYCLYLAYAVEIGEFLTAAETLASVYHNDPSALLVDSRAAFSQLI